MRVLTRGASPSAKLGVPKVDVCVSVSLGEGPTKVEGPYIAYPIGTPVRS